MNAQKITNARDIISRVKTQLVFDSPFFSILVLNMDSVEDPDIATCATEGRNLYYNPQFVELVYAKQGESAATGLVLHEVLHAALGHIWRRETRVPIIWNMACDYVVNSIVTTSGKCYLIPEGGLLDHKFDGMSSEAVYAELVKTISQNIVSMNCVGNNEQCQGSCQGQGGQQSDSKKGKMAKDGDNQGNGQGHEQPWGSHELWGSLEQSNQQAKANWESILAQAAMAAKSRGTMPESLERIVHNILFPKISWQEALYRFLQPMKNDYTFIPPDRRYAAEGIFLPDMRSEELRDIVVAIDTSGSIDEADLTDFMSEVYGIFRSFDKVSGYVTDCDASVKNFVEIDTDDVADIKLHGGGGTDFRPVFEEIEKRSLSPACVVFFTDGNGTFPEQEPSYPVLWIIKNKDKIEVPFGTKIEY